MNISISSETVTLLKTYWWSSKAFAYLLGNKLSTCFSVRPHHAHEGWAAGPMCSSGRDSWLIRAWSIDLEYRQIYYCGRTMRAHSCNCRPNQYWLEVIGGKKKQVTLTGSFKWTGNSSFVKCLLTQKPEGYCILLKSWLVKHNYLCLSILTSK